MKIRVTIIILAVLAFSACQKTAVRPDTARIPDDRQFRVSVKSDGKPVTNLNDRLVHRVTVSKRDIQALMNGKNPAIPFRANVEMDRSGAVAGIRLTEIRTLSVLPTFGLQDGDLVTAVGSDHPRSLTDLQIIGKDLKARGEASLTIVRAGQPHKILYFPH